MARTRKTPRPVFDPQQGSLVAEHSTSSARLREKLRNPYKWCFCELCGRSTEYAIAVVARTVFKRLPGGHAKPVPLTDAIHAEAMSEAEELVARYDRALQGQHGPFEAGQMLATYCNIQEMRGDTSVASFRDQVERRLINAAWARHGDALSATRLPNQAGKAAKPSKLYCEHHNPRRSDEARRAYQRDRRFTAEFKELIDAIWSVKAGELPTWDIEAHAEVRRVAYSKLQAMKAPTRLALSAEMKKRGFSSQAELARQLGMSRQAVSAAIKRQNA